MGVKQSSLTGHHFHGAECNGVQCRSCSLPMRGVCRCKSVPHNQLHGIEDPYTKIDNAYFYFDWTRDGDRSIRTYLYTGEGGKGYRCMGCTEREDKQLWKSALMVAAGTGTIFKIA